MTRTRQESSVRYVWGLDLSIRRSAAVQLPTDFVQPDGSLRWDAVTHGTSRGESLPREAPEVARIKRNIDTARFIRSLVENSAGLAGQTAVFVEDYAYGAAYESARLGEVTGLVKAELYKVSDRAAPVPVNIATARKLLLGTVPRTAKPKAAVERALCLLRCPFDTVDEMDAFAIANYGLSECGFKAVMLQPAEWGGA